MQETVISFYASNPVELFGVNNTNIDTIATYFPRLKIVAQGTDLIARGDKAELEHFTIRMNFLIEYFNNYNKLMPEDIISMLTQKVKRLLSLRWRRKMCSYMVKMDY